MINKEILNKLEINLGLQKALTVHEWRESDRTRSSIVAGKSDGRVRSVREAKRAFANCNRTFTYENQNILRQGIRN